MRFTLVSILVAFALSTAALAAPVSLDARSGDVVFVARAVSPVFTFTGDLANANAQTRAAAAAAVKSVLNAAQTSLTIPDTLAVTLTNGFHTSRADSNNHVTFKFTAPGTCGSGCTGHAYQPGSATVGTIFSDATRSKVFKRTEPEELVARNRLYARVVTPAFTFTGDMNIGANPTPAAQTRQTTAVNAIQALLNAAQNTLGLPNNLAVRATNAFHTSGDPINHATIKFIAPGVCAGGCTGHAYGAGHAPVGRIFSDTTRATVF